MRWCEADQDDYPDSQFFVEDDILYHDPPDGPAHRADGSGEWKLPSAEPQPM
jgi:hypothetical protein